MPKGLSNVRRPLLALIALVIALVIGYVVKGASDSDDNTGSPKPSHTSASSSARSTATSPARSSGHSGMSHVPVAQLPAQVEQTIEKIRAGGPYPYPRNDGVVFHNNERILPKQADGYYHEFTVPTPGSKDRGARRVITGGDIDGDVTFYYTGDHYESFVIVDLGG